MTYTPDQLVQLADRVAQRYVRSKDGSRVVTVDPNDARREIVKTRQQYHAGIVTAAAIMLAESGGDPNAICYNIDDPTGKPTCSRTGPAGPRGYDRGLWQWNSVAWGPRLPNGQPNPRVISDLAAYEPETATDIAYRVSNGFTSWVPWQGSKGLDPAGAAYRTVLATNTARSLAGEFQDSAREEIPFTPVPVAPIANAVNTLTSWTEGLTKLLGAITSADWWRRVGIGALGVVLVVAALIWLGRDTVASTALKTVTGGKT